MKLGPYYRRRVYFRISDGFLYKEPIAETKYNENYEVNHSKEIIT